MKLFNKKENLEDRIMGPEIQEKTGAKKAIIGLTLAGLIVGGGALGLYHECSTNDPAKTVCPITILETKLFGYETGLKHQYRDLTNYENDNFAVSNVEYHEPSVYFTAPSGYVLEDNMAVSYVKPTEVNSVKNDGTVVTHLEVPSGYVLTKDEEGNLVGVKKVAPTMVEESAGISFDKDYGDNYNYGYWSYDGEEFAYDEANFKLTHRMGR